jgi:hypothetical protein
MNPKEAIKRIQDHNERHSKEPFAIHITEALNMAIKALNKQIPKKPIKANRIIKKDGSLFLNDDNEYWKCPICTKYDVPLLENQEYCHCCGQALDWGDTE